MTTVDHRVQAGSNGTRLTKAIDWDRSKTEMGIMHFIKLFLTASFAVAAALRGGVTLISDASGSINQLPEFLVGTSGIAVETLVSLVLGSLLALSLNRSRPLKATRG